MRIKIIITVLALGFIGCSDFLKEESQGEVRPSTVSELEQILVGEGYLKDENIYNITDIFTDNVTCNGITDMGAYQNEFETKKWYYMWTDDMYNKRGGGNNPNFWALPYKGIGTCNVILDQLDKMFGTVEMRENLRGEVLALRAWYYFHLVNLYGYPYNYGDPAKNMGVPLKLDSEVTDAFFTRNSVADVYARIETDLLKGNELMTAYNMERGYFRINHLAIKAMLSRVYLYKEDWDKTIAYADSVLLIKPKLLDLNDLAYYSLSVAANMKGVPSVYGSGTPIEIIWGRQYARSNNISPADKLAKCPFSMSDDIINILGSDPEICSDSTLIRDLRARYYVSWGQCPKDDQMTYYPYALIKDEELGKYQGIRTAELYLNRAEAYAQKYKKEGNADYRQRALNDLDELRQHRMNREFEYEHLDITDPDELLDLIKIERRKELSGEMNHRWFDLKRYGMKTITHPFKSEPDEIPQLIQISGSMYLLPISEEAIRVNEALVQNERKNN